MDKAVFYSKRLKKYAYDDGNELSYKVYLTTPVEGLDYRIPKSFVVGSKDREPYSERRLPSSDIEECFVKAIKDNVPSMPVRETLLPLDVESLAEELVGNIRIKFGPEESEESIPTESTLKKFKQILSKYGQTNQPKVDIPALVEKVKEAILEHTEGRDNGLCNTVERILIEGIGIPEVPKE